MSKLKFTKTIVEEGKNGKFIGSVDVVYNAGFDLKKGTHALTHDEYQTNVPYHLIAGVINTQPQFNEKVINESEILKAVDKVTRLLTERLKMYATQDSKPGILDILKTRGFNQF